MLINALLGSEDPGKRSTASKAGVGGMGEMGRRVGPYPHPSQVLGKPLLPRKLRIGSPLIRCPIRVPQRCLWLPVTDLIGFR